MVRRLCGCTVASGFTSTSLSSATCVGPMYAKIASCFLSVASCLLESCMVLAFVQCWSLEWLSAVLSLCCQCCVCFICAFILYVGFLPVPIKPSQLAARLLEQAKYEKMQVCVCARVRAFIRCVCVCDVLAASCG